MRYKSYVAYQMPGQTGGIFMSHEISYDTAENLNSLIDYISKNYADGKDVIILNIIPLKVGENE